MVAREISGEHGVLGRNVVARWWTAEVPACPTEELEEEADEKVRRSKFVVRRRSLSGGRHEVPVGPDPGFVGRGFGMWLKLRACVAACGWDWRGGVLLVRWSGQGWAVDA
jgi:hypothetical protein